MQLAIANNTTAPVDNAQYSQSVREDTAELASYALSDRGSIHSPSPPRRSVQTNLEAYFNNPSEHESSTTLGEPLQHETIHEVSEPDSPENDGSPTDRPSNSALTDMLRRSPPSTSPTDNAQNGKASRKAVINNNGGAVEPDQRRLIITSGGVVEDERTPLLQRIPKHPELQPHHPDYIAGEDDLEEQAIRRSPSWPKLRNVVQWPQEKGIHIARTIVNPKSWDKKAIWDNAVLAPAACLPAVILGLLLNVLDALSYGMYLNCSSVTCSPLRGKCLYAEY